MPLLSAVLKELLIFQEGEGVRVFQAGLFVALIPEMMVRVSMMRKTREVNQ